MRDAQFAARQAVRLSILSYLFVIKKVPVLPQISVFVHAFKTVPPTDIYSKAILANVV